jgi:hypothetical protein
MRNDKVCAHLQYSMCKALGIEMTDEWYTHTHTHTHKPVCEHEDVTVIWNQGVTVSASRPDIVIKNIKQKPAHSNVRQKKAEKKLKYKSLGIEIQRMWNMKCTIVLVIPVATGMLTKGFKKNMEDVTGKHPIDSLQKQQY